MTGFDGLPVRNRPGAADRVERGVYAQAWYRDSHCYHPSLPPRRLRMAEHFAEYRATMLTWPLLGGGGVSLPYLEQEADGDVPPRFRFYGYVTDGEFIRACAERGIKVFSVIFCMQGWEFPAELSDDEDAVLALNETRGAGKPGWLGLREFTQDTYPRLWPPFRSYFPDGLRNHRGEQVTDLWEECASRGIDGSAHHSHWLECPDRDHECHYMDLNNPVWLEYLKAVIRIHVDAGVAGIQFDEPSSPISALQYGGCFCDVCMDGFTAYLQALDPEILPVEVRAALDGFHYGAWLRAHGKTRVDAAERDFLTDAYATYLRGTAANSFRILTDYAREYAAEQGRTVLLSANLYDGLPVFDPHVAMLDVAVPEQRTTLYRQPGWMRYMAGFAGGKPLIVNVNPYGGVLPELAEDVKHGRSWDRLRVMLYEAAALGVNYSLPYGAWMGSIAEDAFYAPRDLAVEVGEHLAENERFYGGRSLSEVGLVYSVESNFLEVSFRDMTVDDRDVANHGRASGRDIPFFRIADSLAAAREPFDALIFHDGVLREDDCTAEQLLRYRAIVLPDCARLTGTQVDALAGYLARGGRLVLVGEPGCTEAGHDVRRLVEHPGTRTVEASAVADEVRGDLVRLAVTADLAVNLQEAANGEAVLHVVNYDYDALADSAVHHRDVEATVRLPYRPTTVRLLGSGTEQREVPCTAEGGLCRFVIPDVGIYTMAVFGH